MKILFSLLVACLALPIPADAAPPESFYRAKVELREKVYFDQTQSAQGTLYCGCSWKWVGRSGGRVDQKSCGYEVRAQPTRAARTEWEHVVPAWVFGHQRQCWQNGGRKNCVAEDPVFTRMEADMHNLSPSIGEVNGDRSNYRFGMLPSAPTQYGGCQTKTDFKQRVTEPRNEVKGQVARITFYMHDRYGLSMSRQQEQLFGAWHRQYPVSAWEKQRDQRIANVTGNSNPFVTGERTWNIGHKPTKEGLVGGGMNAPRTSAQASRKATSTEKAGQMIIGNRNSNVYHLPVGCPSYEKVGEKNRTLFTSSAEAEAAGFRKAGNCR